MNYTVNADGLARLIRHELHRLSFKDRNHAHKNLKDRFGAYDGSSNAIETEVSAFYGQPCR